MLDVFILFWLAMAHFTMPAQTLVIAIANIGPVQNGTI